MAFQIKNFVSIVASMINHMKGTQKTITDFNVGSVARTLVEAPAIEMDELYQQMFIGLQEAIPVATYNSFNFAALPALPGSGLITLTVAPSANPLLVPAGTVFSYQNGATGYASEADVTIPAGNTTATILVSAVTAGALGNIPANTAFISAAPLPAGFVSATNPAAFTNGTDAETDAQRQQRFAQFIASLARGTIAALVFGAKTTALFDSNGVEIEHVASAVVVEPYIADPTQPIALVDLYVHNGVGGTSSALVTQCLNVINGYIDSNGNKIPGWKAAGVVVNVFAATEIVVNFTGTLTALPGFSKPSLQPLAQAAINNYVLALPIGGDFIVAEAISLVMDIPGVANIVPAPLAPPAAPTLGSVAAGALAGATYFSKITYVNVNGETLASTEASLAVAANHVLTVQSPPAIAGATGWNVYLSTATGTETKQNATPIAIGTNFQEPNTGLIAGAALPAANTAALSDAQVGASQKPMPGTTTIN